MIQNHVEEILGWKELYKEAPKYILRIEKREVDKLKDWKNARDATQDEEVEVIIQC